MKPFLTDLHSHTIASGHAYGTVLEMARAAADARLSVLGITEHAPKLPGTCNSMYFRNFKVIDRELYGVRIMMGAELNIMDYKGTVDLEEELLKKIAYGIASLHSVCIVPGTKKENTDALCGALENPYVKILGHPDDGYYPIDYERMVRSAKENGKLIEINNSSLRPGGRINTRENQKTILKLCERFDQPVIVNTDSHFPTQVGKFDEARELLSEMEFPEELILNIDIESLKKYLPNI